MLTCAISHDLGLTEPLPSESERATERAQVLKRLNAALRGAEAVIYARNYGVSAALPLGEREGVLSWATEHDHWQLMIAWCAGPSAERKYENILGAPPRLRALAAAKLSELCELLEAERVTLSTDLVRACEQAEEFERRAMPGSV